MELESLKNELINPSKTMDLDGSSARAKTSLRLLYEAKARLVRKQLGGLTGIQQELQLSQRKLAQLLMVDPSTWNRWSKNEDLIPPHVWNSLQWYLALQEKIPGLTPQYFLGFNDQVFQERLDGLKSVIKREIHEELMKAEEPASSINPINKFFISASFLLGCGIGAFFALLILGVLKYF